MTRPARVVPAVKPRRARVRKMWMNDALLSFGKNEVHLYSNNLVIEDWQDWQRDPFYLLDASPEAVEGCVEAMADAIRVSRYDHLNRQTTFAHRECERDARAALSALLSTRKR